MSSIASYKDKTHRYICDGMPTLMGCGEEIEITRPYISGGWKIKSTGWLVIWPEEDDTDRDPNTLLHFCPSCALVVVAQRKKEKRG